MAIYWDFNNVIGEAIVEKNKQQFNITVYEGTNCLAVLLYHFVDEEDNQEKYNIYSFFLDLTHLKAQLGLIKKFKGSNLLYESFGFKKFKLLMANKSAVKIANQLIKAGIEVELVKLLKKEENPHD